MIFKLKDFTVSAFFENTTEEWIILFGNQTYATNAANTV